MNALRNKVQLIGNLGGNPEIRNTTNGKKVATFSLATKELYKNAAGEKVSETQWHRVVAWGQTAIIAERLLRKGTEVALEGRLVNRNYIDKSGQKKYVSEVLVNEMLILTKKEKVENTYEI